MKEKYYNNRPVNRPLWRPGTDTTKMHAVLSDEPKTIQQIADESGVAYKRAYKRIQQLRKHHLAVSNRETAQVRYVRGEGPERGYGPREPYRPESGAQEGSQ